MLEAPWSSASDVVGQRGGSVRSSSRDHSFLGVVIWVFVGPLIALGGLAIFVFGFSVLAVAMQLVAAMLKHARM